MNKFLALLLVATLSLLGCSKDAARNADSQANAASEKDGMTDPRNVNASKPPEIAPDSPLAVAKDDPKDARPLEPVKPQPKILQDKTWTWEGSQDNYAKYSDFVFEVGMGDERNGVGCADAGVEIENVRKVKLSVDASPSFKRHDDNSFAGFMVDYHTADGYTKRVALSIGTYSEKRWTKTPIWGKPTTPDKFIDLGKKKEYELDLKEWAPEGWDGKVWFTVSLQNTGRNTKLKGELSFRDAAQVAKEKTKTERKEALGKADVRINELRSLKIGSEGALKGVRYVTFSPDNKLILTCGDDGKVKMWDVAKGEEGWTFERKGGMGYSAAFSPDGKLIAVGDNREVRIVEAGTGKLVQSIEPVRFNRVGGDPQGAILQDCDTHVAFSPDGTKLAVGQQVWYADARADALLTFASTKTWKTETPIRLGYGCLDSVAFSSDGTKVIAGEYVFDIGTRQKGKAPRVEFPKTAGRVGVFARCRDSDLWALSKQNSTDVSFWDLTRSESLKTLTHSSQVRCLAFSPNGRFLVVGCHDGLVELWEVDFDDKKAEAPEGKGKTNAEKIVGVWVLSKSEAGGTLGDTMEFSTDGKLKITATLPRGKTSVNVTYNIEGNKLTWTLKGPPRDSTEILTIKSLTDSILVTEDSKGRVEQFKRKGKDEDELIEPTEQQLQDAVKAFEKKGCKLFKHSDSVTKKTTYFFELPKEGTDLDMANLPDVPFSFGLVIPETRVTDAALKQLADNNNLTELLLGGLYLTDAGLKEIAKFKALRKLSSLSDCPQVTDSGLKELTNLKSLTDLDLLGTKITDEGLKEIGRFNNLTTLGLGGSKATDAGLKEIVKVKRLTGLGLAGTKISDAGLKEVASLKNLTKLNLANTTVTDDGLKELANLTNLVSLDLRGTQVSDAGVAELRKALPKANLQK
jgi:uncharacterized protein (TIGR03066 family)